MDRHEANLVDHGQAAAGFDENLHVVHRLEARADARLRLAHTVGGGGNPTVFPGQQEDNAIRLVRLP